MNDNKILENVALKICRECKVEKIEIEFPQNRRICKKCTNEIRKKREKANPELLERKKANFKKRMQDEKYNKHFWEKRKKRYHENEKIRQYTITNSIKNKQRKREAINLIKQQEQKKIGLENKICKYCGEIKLKSRFRHNRLKCKDCERDEPIEKLKRCIRSRIHISLRCKNKTKNEHTIEYLGCSCNQYLQYILNYNASYTLENRGTEWHIDHIIPISKFNLHDDNELKLAFNWRNTMPISKYENLSKNNKILKDQVTQHFQVLVNYHKKNNIKIPKQIMDLFAKHLDAGNPSIALTTTLLLETLEGDLG